MYTMKTRIFFTIVYAVILLSNSKLIASNDSQARFELGNNYYNQQVLDSALIQYQMVLSEGMHSAALYYNIGNTYFKLRDIPSAILYYEKALKIKPNDDDVRHNLEIANALIVDKIEQMPQLFFRQWWNAFYTMFPADTWAWVSLLFFALTLLAVYVYIVSFKAIYRKVAFFGGLLLFIGTIGTFGLASQKYYYTQQTNEAILFVPTITVKSAPNTGSVDLFVLHAGTKVSLLDEANGWRKIKIANGSVGWLPDNVIRGI
jgi:tetratricopeptide (TPR) repeat protein